jgi:hypothetical protein
MNTVLQHYARAAIWLDDPVSKNLLPLIARGGGAWSLDRLLNIEPSKAR